MFEAHKLRLRTEGVVVTCLRLRVQWAPMHEYTKQLNRASAKADSDKIPTIAKLQEWLRAY